MITRELLASVMQDAWSEICDDTGAHPEDICREGKKLFYQERHWTDLTVVRLNERLALSERGEQDADGSTIADDVKHMNEVLDRQSDLMGPSPAEPA